MNIGYARVSTQDQNLDRQVDALESFGCQKIYKEKRSGSRDDRPDLDSCLSDLREGDTLVVCKLDRLGRSVKQLVMLVNEFKEKNIGFVCLEDNINTSSASGEFFFHVMSAFAQLERSLIIERTHSGLKAARSRGKLGGRPSVISKEKKEMAYERYMENKESIQEITALFGMSRMTLYRYIEKKRGMHIK